MIASGTAARLDRSRKSTPEPPASGGRTRATDSRQRPRRREQITITPSHQSTRLALKSHPRFLPRAGVAGYGCARVLVRQPEPIDTAQAPRPASTGTLPRQPGGQSRHHPARLFEHRGQILASIAVVAIAAGGLCISSARAPQGTSSGGRQSRWWQRGWRSRSLVRSFDRSQAKYSALVQRCAEGRSPQGR